MELEFKHLTPYGENLGLLDSTGVFMTLEGFDFSNKSVIAERINYKLTEVKPVLRSLSNLTEDLGIISSLFNWYFKKDNMIDINLSSYYNKEKNYTWINYKYSVRYDNFSDTINGGSQFNHNDIFALPYMIMEELLSKHYDVFGLIPEGLARDINTLKPFYE